MNKHFIVFVVLFFCLAAFPQDKVPNVEQLTFEGININNSPYKIDEAEENTSYNLVFSPLLPTDAIYLITDETTKKEAIIQIGHTQVDKSPYYLYMPTELFNFFSKVYENPVETLSIKVKFLGWNKKGEESSFLNLHNLIVKEENSLYEITNNGLDKYYIQIGAFSYYQNAYPVIIDVMPLLDALPKFYILKKDVNINGENKSLYRILVGPYQLEEARRISKLINAKKNASVFLHSAESIISEYSGEKLGE